MSDTSLGQMFLDRAAQHPQVSAFRVRRGDAYADVTYKEARARVEAIAAGYLSIPGGIAKRATIGILASTSMDWILCDYAAMTLDVVVAPIYATLMPPEIGYILVDASVEVLVVENKKMLDK